MAQGVEGYGLVVVMKSERNDATGLTVKLPVHIMMALLDQPGLGEQWKRQAAREYAHREVKKLFPQTGQWEKQ